MLLFLLRTTLLDNQDRSIVTDVLGNAGRQQKRPDVVRCCCVFAGCGGIEIGLQTNLEVLGWYFRRPERAVVGPSELT